MEAIAAIEQYAWIGWIVLIALFLVIEMLTLDFTFLMIGIGSAAGLVADLVGAPVWLQVVVAGIVSLVLILFLRPSLLRRLRRGEDPALSNVAALLGTRGVVTLAVSATTGQVKLVNGDVWTARSDDDIAPGSTIRVTRIDGATAVVAANEEDRS